MEDVGRVDHEECGDREVEERGLNVDMCQDRTQWRLGIGRCSSTL